MCGIAGWIDFAKDISDNDKIFDSMSDTLKRRGPDDGGKYISKHAVLLHRRLAVVDIENGKQPMYKSFAKHEYVAVYNGELYNTEELRTELKALGHKFSGHSDTEVVLTAYIEWREECLEKLNGIFAFAILDKKLGRVFAARDRAGVKPFFFHKYEDGFIFGSEIKTLLAHPYVSPRVTKEGIGEIFLIGPGRTPGASAFKDIKELEPGNFAIFDKNGLVIKEYWSLKAKEHIDSPEETAEKVRELVLDSISRQLVSDVPLCTFLSGGLDSSIISSAASEAYSQRGEVLTTYSVDYTDNDKYFKANVFQPNSDDYFIDIMKEAIGSAHKKVVLDNKSVAEALFDSTLARDLPGMADVDSSLLLFCREVKKTHTVALSGECADEIFGGYPWYSNPEVFYAEDFPWSGNTSLKARLIKDKLLTFDPCEYVYERYLKTAKSAPKTGDETKEDSRMKEVTMLNLKWFMQTLLDRKDRMSMYSGLEVRVPFCDHRIMQYAYNIPREIKMYKNREKGLLRKAFEGYLPNEIVSRKKSPYPKSHHPKYVEAVKAYADELLKTPCAPIWEVVNKREIKNLLETEAAEYTRPWYGQLMNFPQIMAYIYGVNVWLSEYGVNIV